MKLAPLAKVIYESMGWENEYYFRIPCRCVKGKYPSAYGDTVLVFDLDNYVGQTSSKKEEAVIAKKETVDEAPDHETAKSYYYPPDEDEPQEISEIEAKFQQAVETNKKLFGTPVHLYDPGIRTLAGDPSKASWEMMAEARPLDIAHTVDETAVDTLFHEIRENPPALRRTTEVYPDGQIDVPSTSTEE